MCALRVNAGTVKPDDYCEGERRRDQDAAGAIGSFVSALETWIRTLAVVALLGGRSHNELQTELVHDFDYRGEGGVAGPIE